MAVTPKRDKELARQGRLVSIVIAVSFTLWLIVNAVGGPLGIPVQYAFLFDFAALGAMLWALIVALRIWRERRG